MFEIRQRGSSVVREVFGGLTTFMAMSYIIFVQFGLLKKTGLAAIVTGVLMMAAVFFQPIIRMIGGGVEVAPGVAKYPLIAPALIFVGAMMLRCIREIDWDDATEYFPAFLTVIVMPLAMSISHGIAIGFVSYSLGKLLTGRVKQCPPAVYIVSALFVLRYILWPL